MIKLFKDIKKCDYKYAGGKGLSLSKMAIAGFNVPNGLVVGSDVFAQFIKDNKLNAYIEKLIEHCDIAKQESLAKTSKKIKKAILKARISKELEKEILTKFDRLNCEFVAVRSSATVEDGKANAWAGQLDTFLFVKKENLVANIKKCWASLFGERAIYYRLKNKFTKEIAVAVVVQSMMSSEFSGVAFSNDPMGEGNVIIECVEGLGEAIVSGAVTPDKYIIRKNKLEVKVANQTRKLVYNEEHNLTYVDTSNNSQKLSNANIKKLHAEIKKIKAFYGFEVDIEWCVVKDVLYILQCRPITVINNNRINNIAKDILKSDTWEFYVKRPFHWLLESTQILAGSEKEQNKYLGFNIALQNYLILNGDEYFSVDEDKKNKQILKNILINNPNFFDDYAKTLFNIVEDNLKYVEFLNTKKFRDLSDDQIISEYKRFKKNYIKSVVPTFARPDFFLESEFYEILNEDYKLDKESCDDIFVNISTCSNDYGPLFYSEEPLDLLKIAHAKQTGKNISSMIKSHHKKYAWLKAPVIEQTTMFTIDDYKTRIDNLINQHQVEAKIRNIENAREENDKNFERTIKKYNLTGRALKMAKTIRTYIFLRTYMTEHTDHLFFNARITLLKEICRRFKIKECDLVMLSLDEIQMYISGKFKSKKSLAKILTERRKGFAMVWLNKKCTIYFGQDALELQNIVAGELLSFNDNLGSDSFVKGDIANKGKVSGVAKVISSYDDVKKVSNGDIIVASMTTPDYVAAMEKAVGFVTDEGGITCHAAIISREFSIPCIVGTVNATKIIHDGDVIELDAYKGIVKIIKRKN